jgi:hypothetical protein
MNVRPEEIKKSEMPENEVAGKLSPGERSESLPDNESYSEGDLEALSVIDARLQALVQQLRIAQVSKEEKRTLVAEKARLEMQRREITERMASQYEVDCESVPADLLSALTERGCTNMELHVLRSILPELPQKRRDAYTARLQAGLADTHEVAGMTGIQGVLFELSRIDALERQGLEKFDFDAGDLNDVSYNAFDKKETSFDHAPTKNVSRAMEIDIPILREGKPYVYEVKSYPRMPFGSTAAQRNQLLKYQAAVEQDLVAGASVELRGRLDADFLRWATGTSVGEEGALSDVELLYTFELPSGLEYRFDLNRPSKPGAEGLRFQNEGMSVTPEATLRDMREKEPERLRLLVERFGNEVVLLEKLKRDRQVIQGIQRARLDKSIIGILCKIDLPEASEALGAHLHDPMTIDSMELYREYENLRHESIYHNLLEKRNVINVNNEKNACSGWATQEFVEETVREYQAFLKQNPEMARIKKAYILRSEEDMQAVIEKTMASIEQISAYELERLRQETIDGVAPRKRVEMGYAGMQEGVALDIEHIIIDAIQDVNKTEGKTGRSYDMPERFRPVEKLPDYLETQDRGYRALTVYDPKNDTFESNTAVNEKHITRTRAELLKQNIVRAEEQIQAWRTTLTEMEELPRSDAGNSREKNFLKARIRAHGMVRGVIQKHHERIALLEEEKTMAIRSEKDNVNKKNLAMKFDTEITNEREALVERYRDIAGGVVEWEKLAKRITENIDQNIIKFIYVVNAEGEVIVDEEKVRGSSTTGRAAHSELARGRNVYGAGELVFEKNEQGEWYLQEINNGSGHYRPSAATLGYVKNIVAEKGIKTDRVTLRDSLMRGASLPDLTLFEDAPINENSHSAQATNGAKLGEMGP